MTATEKVQHEEHWEALAMLLAEVLRRILQVPRPGSMEERVFHQDANLPPVDQFEEVSS